MNTKRCKTKKIDRPEQRAALASPLRLEILGLFTHGDALAIADMAALMGRKAGSLYHHVGILEKADLLERVGTRPKGKRHEALFGLTAGRFEVDAPADQDEAIDHAVKAMASAFRMTERDLEAALRDRAARQEGRDRNMYAARLHMRASPKLLAAINEHLSAIEDLLQADAAGEAEPSTDAEHLSLTIALLPIKGRSRKEPHQGG
ncbi:MAG: helix-turn-helix domain-containing protein [bacterium]|nr:helix-turn-helix domain-containing protein [bacterium]